MVTRTYKFRLYPTQEQYSKLYNVLGACRWTYNQMVEKINIEGFQSAYDLNYFLTELKEQSKWLYEYHSKMLQMVSTQIHSSQKSLQELEKKGYKTGKLKFALYSKYSTFVYNQSGFDIKDNSLTLSKIGKISMISHREIPNNANVKQVTVSRQASKWYASVTFDVDIVLPRLVTKSVGVDVGITNFAYDSDGHVTPNPRILQKMVKPLRRMQRRISRRQKGSQNRKKAIKQYQRIHQKISNIRKDFCHKLSTTYTKKYGTIYAENLQISNMVKNHRLARNILDSGWGIFKKMLSYKTNLVLVAPNNTTVDCSRCGTKVPKTLAVRTHICDVCGLILDRDHNAAINILKKGLELQTNRYIISQKLYDKIPQELREFTPVEIPKESLKQEEATEVIR